MNTPIETLWGEIFPVSGYSIGIQDWYTVQDACERYFIMYLKYILPNSQINRSLKPARMKSLSEIWPGMI